MNRAELVTRYKTYYFRKLRLITIFFIILIVLVTVCTTIGITELYIKDVVNAVIKKLCGMELLSKKDNVILFLRLPRVILAIVVGSGLGIAGATMQGISRNPLVSPFTIGVSSAAAFGASLTIVYGIGILVNTKWGIVINAFLFSILCILIIFLISWKVGLESSSLILTGVGINYLFQALSTAIQFTATDAKLGQVIAWTFGSLNGANWAQIDIILVIMIISFVVLLKFNHSFTILSIMDDEVAKTMGINPNKVRIVGSFFSLTITAAIISFSGVIGFIGLAAPHVARSLVGTDYKLLLPMSGIVGALLILVSDTLGRTLFSPIIIPVGIIVSFIGVPIFLRQIVLSSKKNR